MNQKAMTLDFDSAAGDVARKKLAGAINYSMLELIFESMSLSEKVEGLNHIRSFLHALSPFKDEPVDCVLWVRGDTVVANDYNPNSVAPPEMELLRLSIEADGYTQPIVSMPVDEKIHEVVDGFHRHRVGRECPDIQRRICGYLPLVEIREEQYDKSRRMASTIRHNRARGKHKVDAMSDIVLELKRRNWDNEKISRELGMDADEVLRLCQISGLQEMFSDQEFSRAWDVEGEITEADFEELSDDVSEFLEDVEKVRVPNTNDEQRIFHTHDKWECYKAGFYATTPPEGMSKHQCEEAYREFLSDIPRFADALNCVVTEWKHSCEHYLTNTAMNRIAWLGQASMCYATGVPSMFRSGFSLLEQEQQEKANQCALEYLNKWLIANGREPVTMEEALSHGRQSDIY